MPGPLLRVTEADTVTIVLTNDAANLNSHSIDLHAAQVDVLSDFSDVQPGETQTFSFLDTSPRAFFYPCHAAPMSRSDERRVGNEGVRSCRCCLVRSPYKQHK